MKKIITLTFILLFISGCATISEPIPEGYEGPLAHIKDSKSSSETSGVDFFVLDAINGKYIEESIMRTSSANYGRGFYMKPIVIGRQVPVKEATFNLLGRTHYAAPILALTNTVYQIKGGVKFSPKPNAKYVVKGKLGKKYSAVWIEEEATKKIVGNKIEKHGSSSLGFFEK